MSKGRLLTKRKYRDFRKTKRSKIKWVKNLKFPRKWKLLHEVTHMSMGLPKKRKILEWYL